jgi:hypothetical protein
VDKFRRRMSNVGMAPEAGMGMYGSDLPVADPMANERDARIASAVDRVRNNVLDQASLPDGSIDWSMLDAVTPSAVDQGTVRSTMGVADKLINGQVTGSLTSPQDRMENSTGSLAAEMIPTWQTAQKLLNPVNLLQLPMRALKMVDYTLRQAAGSPTLTDAAEQALAYVNAGDVISRDPAATARDARQQELTTAKGLRGQILTPTQKLVHIFTTDPFEGERRAINTSRGMSAGISAQMELDKAFKGRAERDEAIRKAPYEVEKARADSVIAGINAQNAPRLGELSIQEKEQGIRLRPWEAQLRARQLANAEAMLPGGAGYLRERSDKESDWQRQLRASRENALNQQQFTLDRDAARRRAIENAAEKNRANSAAQAEAKAKRDEQAAIIKAEKDRLDAIEAVKLKAMEALSSGTDKNLAKARAKAILDIFNQRHGTNLSISDEGRLLKPEDYNFPMNYGAQAVENVWEDITSPLGAILGTPVGTGNAFYQPNYVITDQPVTSSRATGTSGPPMSAAAGMMGTGPSSPPAQTIDGIRGEVAAQVRAKFKRAMGRPPTQMELEEGIQFELNRRNGAR